MDGWESVQDLDGRAFTSILEKFTIPFPVLRGDLIYWGHSLSHKFILVKAVTRIIVLPIDDFEVFDDENGVNYFDGAFLTAEDDRLFVLSKVHTSVDEDAIAFAEVLGDCFSATVPDFTAKPGDFLNFVPGFGFVAFVYGHVEVGDGGFGAGVTGNGVIAETTEDGNLV